MLNFLLTGLGCVGFTKPVHCLVIIVAVAFNVLLQTVRNARNMAMVPDGVTAITHEIPLRPTCSYAVLIVLHLMTACYFANQLSMLRRQLAIAKTVCLLHFVASFLTFFSAIVTLCNCLHVTDDDDLLTIFAESICFLILVSDFAKPLHIVKLALNGDPSALSSSFIAVLTENFFDLLMQMLIISLGILFRLPAVLRACTYASLGLTSSFISFYLIVPSVLSIAMSLDAKFDNVLPKSTKKTDFSVNKTTNNSSSLKKGKHVFVVNVAGDANPLARRVKFIMSAAILLVHAHSKLKPSSSLNPDAKSEVPHVRVENVSFGSQQNLVTPTQTKPQTNWSDFDEVSTADWGLTLVLAVVISLRFLLFSGSSSDETIDEATSEEEARVEFQQGSSSSSRSSTPPCHPKKISTSSLDNSADDSPCCSRKSPPSNPTPASVQFRPARKRIALPDDSLFLKSDEEIIDHLFTNELPLYSLEEKLMTDANGKENGATRAVAIRRGVLAKRHPTIASAIDKLPYVHYGEFANVVGACCENVVGTIPLPVGLAGPLLVDDVEYLIPMSTTEGCLVASVNRGCKVLTSAGGVRTVLLNDGMTRAPVVRLPDVTSAAELRSWLKNPEIFEKISVVFNGTSRFLRLSAIEPFQAGTYVYIRFVAQTGDAMGMNMVSRACESALSFIIGEFPACRLLSLSGNACADKKSAAINWLMGRGKSVISEAIIPRQIVCDSLRTTPEALVRLNTAKNLIGSAVAGAVAGGFNAHAANILAALYLATGQDVAQVVESSACLTILEVTGDTPATSTSEEPHSGDLHITCTLPTLEVGTVGGGTILGPQKSCLDILGVAGSAATGAGLSPGDNARRLARIAAAAVLAGELSLLAALATNQLMPAHLRLNRSQQSMSTSHSPTSANKKITNNNNCES